MHQTLGANEAHRQRQCEHALCFVEGDGASALPHRIPQPDEVQFILVAVLSSHLWSRR